MSAKLLTFAPHLKKCSGFSAVGSAHVWGARGRWFESSNPDTNEHKGLTISPLCVVGGVSVGEKSEGIGNVFIIVSQEVVSKFIEMAKKNFVFGQSSSTQILEWKTPVFHQKKECYISFSAFDPAIGKLRTKKVMLGHVKGRRAQRVRGEYLVRQLTEKLMQGWNPWIEAAQPTEYTPFEEVCDRYRDYLLKLVREGNMREETLSSYLSRLKVLREWNGRQKVGKMVYSYQFNKVMVGRFLDFIFIDRNNTLQTRNNYLGWVKVFGKYLVERGYVAADPTAGLTQVKVKNKVKNRDVIPDEVLVQIHDYLAERHRHYLLACYILHYCLIRPREMSYLKVCDFSVERQTLLLHGDHTKNHDDAVITVPRHVLDLMVGLGVFNAPGNYYLFGNDFMPGPERKSEKQFRDYWHLHVRKDLGFSSRFKFYSLKDTGITNMLRMGTDILSVRDQARHSSVLITDIYTPKDIKEANKLLLNYKGVL